MPAASKRSPSARRRALAELAAVSVFPAGRAERVRHLARARDAGMTRRALTELGLMLRLYAGFPAAIEFLRALELSWPKPRPARNGRTIGSRAASYGDAPRWQRAGTALCRRVYGPEYEPLRAFMQRLDPDLDDWMILEGYGKTLSRPGLSIVDRELATVASLAALGWTPQLGAHRAGAARVGARAAEVRDAERIGERCRRARAGAA